MIPGGWNIQKGTSDNKHDPRPVKSVMERTELIPVEWPCLRRHGGERDNSWWMEQAEGGQ